MTFKYVPVFADQLQPGDYCARTLDGDDRFTVLRPHVPTEDLFGRAMIRYWCRALADDREGWMTYGPSGTVLRQVS